MVIAVMQMHARHFSKPFVVLLFIALCYLWFSWTFLQESIKGTVNIEWSDDPWQNPGTYCYKEDSSVIVFLHVTDSLVWSPVQMCSFKLAAFHNNDTGVCVLSAYPIESHRRLKRIKNLEIAPLNMTLLFQDTPLENWYHSYILDKINRSHYWAYEISDALRYVYLYKYGGKYMDTDSWTLRNLRHLRNMAAWEADDNIANGVMFFDKGHPFIEAILYNFTSYFRAGQWGSAGPTLVTEVHMNGIVNQSLYNITSYWDFYPIFYNLHAYPYLAGYKNGVEEVINGSYTIHLWGKFTKNWVGATESYVRHVLGTICA